MDFIGGWNDLIAISGLRGLFDVLALVGVAIFVVALLIWGVKKWRGHASGMKGFPWWALLVLALFSATHVTVPIFLGIAQAAVNIGAAIGSFVVGLFG